ncbi:hypothetical protein A9Q76_08180 [Arcobacter sp. 31_11_sub10_T18]|nr:hypothetical protein A9Q76_08180 [Arcobacter sp. 31_11_sub10_T18]
MDGYSFALIIHLFSAVFFIGFVFSDVVILPVLNKDFDLKTVQQIKESIFSRGRKVMPLAVLTLILSGGFMFSKYINTSLGFTGSSLQILLLIKFALAMIIVSGIIYSLICKIRKKQPHNVMKKFHTYVLILGIIIIILAKVMFIA